MINVQLEVYVTPDGLGRAAIVQRSDKLLVVYVHWIWEETSRQAFNVVQGGRKNWRDDKTSPHDLYADLQPEPGLYQTIDDARVAVINVSGFSLATLQHSDVDGEV